jgi:hypothetical protein
MSLLDGKCWCGGTVWATPGAPPTFTCAEGPTHDPFGTGVPDHVTSLYVAGPMTGHPESNYPAFMETSKRLRDAGYTVVNPAEVSLDRLEKVHYLDFLREDLVQMLTCRGVCILPDWWASTGARNEVNVAGLLKMPVRTEAEWLERAHKELS